jgi:alpha-glucosidase
VLQDPVWERSGRTVRGRDGCRVPVPWAGDQPPFGFSGTAGTWLPVPASWRDLTVEAQDADPASMLSLYRTALRLRRTSAAVAGESLQWLEAPRGCLAFRRPGGLVCLLNTSAGPVPLPGGEVLLASADVSDGYLPVDAAVWTAPREA